MAGITQTIPQYSLGMSEQPDQLKFPGQVQEVTNAIPDITRGLFKRPGAKRIGTDKLANVQSGGSWFHYFRDETEGAYIGQVAADGELRMWKASGNNAGAQQTVVYGTGGATALKNYLATSNSENLQFLTINDTTFVNSRDSGNTNTVIRTTFSGTYSQSGTTVTITFIDHGLSVGDNVNVEYTTGSAVDGNFLVQTVTSNTFTLTAAASATLSGNVTIKPLTDTTPDKHFAFLELLRTENGRQYGVNIHGTGTQVTSVSRATAVKISADNLDESDGSGHCPGIGTQVFSVTGASSYSNVTTVSVKNSAGVDLSNSARTDADGNNIGAPRNLIFRLDILGQQGVSPNYNANENGPDGQNYRCSYNRNVVLLHGGEGWKLGDKVQVLLDSAAGGADTDSGDEPNDPATYTIEITGVEVSPLNATISSNGDGVIRPEPTPFDADTAVTSDTIIGGIIDALPSGITGKHIGNGIYFSSPNQFQLEVVEDDLMRSFQSSVNDVQNLPNQCKHGYIVKVSNALRADEDDYYLRFDGTNNKDGSGSWSECAKPGISKTLVNMPLAIQRTAIANKGTSTEVATFTIKQFGYRDRRVGDDLTNPLPSFVNSRINKVLFFRNRLALLSGENVITSRPGSLGNPDFFIETALTVSASDPVDISAASTFPSELFDGIDTNTGLLIFSTNQQFLLAADDTVFNPDTAKLRSVSTFNYNETIAPISLGTTIAYIDNSGKFSRFNEMANIRREGEPSIVDVSKVVPTLLPKDIDLLTNSRENSIILMSKTGSDEVFGYRYFQVSEQRQQAAWFKWKLNNPLTYHFIINDEYFFLDSDYYLQSIKLVQTSNDPSIVQDETDFLLHVDNHTTVSGGSFNATTNITTFSGVGWLNTVTTPNHDLVVIDTNTSASRVGRYAKPTVSGTSFTVPGKWDGVTLVIGYIYPYEVKFPRFYPTRQQGNASRADVNASLVIHRLKIHFGKIGLYETTLKRVGKTDYTEVYESTQLDEYDVSDAPYLDEFIKTIPVYERNTNVDVILRSSHPAPATLRALAWEGDFSPRFYKRV